MLDRKLIRFDGVLLGLNDVPRSALDNSRANYHVFTTTRLGVPARSVTNALSQL